MLPILLVGEETFFPTDCFSKPIMDCSLHSFWSLIVLAGLKVVKFRISGKHWMTQRICTININTHKGHWSRFTIWLLSMIDICYKDCAIMVCQYLKLISCLCKLTYQIAVMAMNNGIPNSVFYRGLFLRCFNKLTDTSMQGILRKPILYLALAWPLKDRNVSTAVHTQRRCWSWNFCI